jgi:hypothetical protein
MAQLRAPDVAFFLNNRCRNMQKYDNFGNDFPKGYDFVIGPISCVTTRKRALSNDVFRILVS